MNRNASDSRNGNGGKALRATLTILLIDSDRSASSELRDYLRFIGHQVVCSDDCRALPGDGNFDLALIDLPREQDDSRRLIDHIAAARAAPVVAFMSDGAIETINAACAQARAHGLTLAGVLSKPLRPPHVAALLEQPHHGAAGSPRAEPRGDSSPGAPAAHYVFQSRHALHDGSVVGYDTLLRIPGVDAIGPWFAARDHDTAFDLTLAAARAASDLSRHLPDGRQNAIVAFHCPPAIFCDARFLREMTLLAQTAGHVRDSIAIGLATPTGNLRFNDLRDIAFRYVLAGFRLHLTDFTLETDNLQQMTCLPLSEAKLDCRVFLHELRMNDPLLLPEILSLLRLRGIRSTIAQIETAENVELARRAGADCGQGRYWSHPIQPLHASS